MTESVLVIVCVPLSPNVEIFTSLPSKSYKPCDSRVQVYAVTLSSGMFLFYDVATEN